MPPRTFAKFRLFVVGVILHTAFHSPPVAFAVESLRRVGHSDVRQACLSDGSARLQHYWDLAAFDWGGVVPLNSWYHPQLMKFDPASGLLEHQALAIPHQGQGNEDDPRQRIHAHHGRDARSSHVLFSIFGYEEIDDENGKHARDSAVMSIRPKRIDGAIRLPRRSARVVNLSQQEAKRGLGSIPASCGSPYDARRRIVFAPRERPSELEGREMFQMFRLDAQGRFESRAAYAMPRTFRKRHFTTFMDIDSQRGLIAIGAVTPWDSIENQASLYLLRYETSHDPNEIATISAPRSLDGLSIRTPQGQHSALPTAAVFADDGADLYLLIASGRPTTRYDAKLRGGIFIFHLGPKDGPIKLGRPVGLISVPCGVEELKASDGRLYASSNGLYAFDLKKAMRTRGLSTQAQCAENGVLIHRYPLPYDTHGFDFARMNGRRFLFLSAGRHGLDAFEIDAVAEVRPKQSDVEKTGSPTTIALQPKNSTTQFQLRGREVRVLLRSGDQFLQFGKPAIDPQGNVCCWAITRDHREAIVHRDRDGRTLIIAKTGERYVALGRPVINASGEIAFWAATVSGRQAIFAANAQGELEERTGGMGFRYLREPRIANDGRIVFLGLAKNRRTWRRAIYLADSAGVQATLFDEREGGRVRLGAGLPGDFGADYDISPDGQRVVFLVRELKPKQQDRLYQWEQGRRRDLGSLGRDMQHVRFGTGGGFLTFRRWKDEVLAACRISLQNEPVANSLIETARRHSHYGELRFNPGEFIGARADARGNVVMSIVENVQSARDAVALGDQIWSFDSQSKQVRFLARPQDQLGDSTVLSASFEDALNANGQIAARLDLKSTSSADAHVVQAIVLWPN